MVRQLSSQETDFIRRVAESHPRRAQIEQDLLAARVASESADRIEFELEGYNRPAYTGHSAIGEGKVQDEDGAALDVVLNADSQGHLLEIEFIRYEPGEVVGPIWSTLSLIVG